MGIISKIASNTLPPPLNWIISGLGWVKDMLAAALCWAIAHPWQAGCIVLGLYVAFLHLHTMPSKNHEIAVQSGAKNIAARWFVDERRAYHKFIKQVERARIDAAELDRQNVERFKTETTARISEIENENIELRDRNRGLVADRMRRAGVHTASVSLGSGGTANLPVISDMSGGIVPGTGAAIISESDALICADNYSTLTSLIAAWKVIEAVDVNGN